MNDWLIIVLVYLTLFLGSTLITVLHELGHAFAYLWLTKPENIDIYVGSYGNKTRSANFRMGKLNFYVKRSWLPKGIGLCASSKWETDYRKHIVILLAGVFFSLFFACIPCVIVFYTQPNQLVQIVCYLFLALSAWGLLINLVPVDIGGSWRNYNADRSGLESDGMQILFVLKARKAYSDYVSALKHAQTKEYDIALEKLETVNKTIPKTAKILRRLYGINLQTGQYNEALKYLNELAAVQELSVDDLVNKGGIYSFIGQHDEAIATYQTALKKNRNHVYGLNNLGYEMVKKSAHEVAEKIFNKVLKLSPGFPMTLCNVAYSNLMQERIADAKAIIDKLLQDYPEYAEAYLYRAIYYLKLNKPELAAEDIAKAKELDNKIITVDYDEELEKLSQTARV